MPSTVQESDELAVSALLADETSQLLALADALECRDPVAISSTVRTVMFARGINSLADSGGIDRKQLKDAIVRLNPQDCELLQAIVAALLRDAVNQAPTTST